LLRLSQTPEAQTRVAAPVTEHWPVSRLACGPEGSIGSGVPLTYFAVHVWVEMKHQLPAEQSASTSQLPGAMQTSLALHVPLRQTVPEVQGPSPLA
jgi:hypothetical protein